MSILIDYIRNNWHKKFTSVRGNLSCVILDDSVILSTNVPAMYLLRLEFFFQTDIKPDKTLK